MCEIEAHAPAAGVEQVDQQAWEELVRRYGPLIHRWCLHWELQEADAHERKAAELEEAVERHRRFAHRHEDAANEKQQEIENVGGGGFRLRSRG